MKKLFMPIDPIQNEVLKKMWDLDDKLQNDEPLNPEEKDFYNTNLQLIKNYYKNHNEYWSSKNAINEVD